MVATVNLVLYLPSNKLLFRTVKCMTTSQLLNIING